MLCPSYIISRIQRLEGKDEVAHYEHLRWLQIQLFASLVLKELRNTFVIVLAPLSVNIVDKFMFQWSVINVKVTVAFFKCYIL